MKLDGWMAGWLVCLFDLWFYVPVNNYGHVEMGPHCSWAFLAVNQY